jgi:hypothetical protein
MDRVSSPLVVYGLAALAFFLLAWPLLKKTVHK